MRVMVVSFRDLSRWDVKYAGQPQWSWESDGVMRFGDVAVRRVEPVDRVCLPPEEIRLASIHFDGSVTPRSVGAEDLKGRLFFAYPGDLVFSKIDVRSGAIGVIPETLGRVAFTSEYPVYDLRAKNCLRAEFVKLLCRTTVFREKVNALVVGHSGRKRVSPEQMEGLSIPVPSVQEQQKILDRFGELMESVEHTRTQASVLSVEATERVLRTLGIETVQFERIRGPFIVRSKDLDRWSVRSAMLVIQGISEEPIGIFPLRALGNPDVSSISYGIQKHPGNRPGDDARPYLRVANVQAGRLDLTNVKMINVPDEQMPAFRLQYGDLLLCEGNSEELVGRPAMWRDEIPDCVHQNHVLRVRLNQELLDPEYVLAYMSTQPARLYFLGRAKRTTNLASINSNDVREMPIPVPPKDVQRRIADELSEAQANVDRLEIKAKELSELAWSEIDGMVAWYQSSIVRTVSGVH